MVIVEETHLTATMVVTVVGIVVSLAVAVARAVAADVDPILKASCLASFVARKGMLSSTAERGLMPHSPALLRRVHDHQPLCMV